MAVTMLPATVGLLERRTHSLLSFLADQLGKVHSTGCLVGFGHPSCLLVASVLVVIPALLGVACRVCAPMFLAERTMLLCPALPGLLGGT